MKILANGESEHAARQLAAIVESPEDAIVSKSLDGVIQSWNKAAERMFGYTADEIIGKPILVLIPQERQHEEETILRKIRSGERVEHFETVRRHKDGTLLDISLTVSPIKDAFGKIVGASKTSRDIREKKRFEKMLQVQAERMETLLRVSVEISRHLDLQPIVQTVTDMATELTRARFGAFFYNVLNEKGESYLLYTLSGAPREAFDKFGMPRNTAVFDPTFRGEDVVRVADIRKDPRYGKNHPHFGMPKGHLPVVSYLAVPVVASNGHVHGGLFFGHDQPGIFTEDTESLVRAIAAQAAVAMDNARLHQAAQDEIEQRRKAEAAKELLLHEIKHRVKNTLGTVQAIVVQTFRTAAPHEHHTFVARLHALSEAHDLLTQRNWGSVTTAEIVEQALRPFGDDKPERISVSGPGVELTPNKALLIAMLLHELGTNAVKYGALSTETGNIHLTWIETNGGDRKALEFCWKESGGPMVAAPTRKGFGSRMIERALQAEQGSSKLQFEPSGLICEIRMPL